MIQKFNIDNYIVVPGFAIVELGLSGNELLCYSLIYGFTQDNETEFHGSLNYVASALNVTKQNAKKIIDRLIERGLIIKREMFFSGVKFCHYVTNRPGVAEIATGGYQNNNGGVAEMATNDINKNNTIDKIEDKYNFADGDLFPAPDKQRKVRKTSEPLCLFADSRFAAIEIFQQEFEGPEFTGIDIVYYYHAVADWSAQRGIKRKDWIAQTRNFIRKDMEANKVHRMGGALSADVVEYFKDMAEGL